MIECRNRRSGEHGACSFRGGFAPDQQRRRYGQTREQSGASVSPVGATSPDGRNGAAEDSDIRQGDVENVTIESGHPLLVRAAEDAVIQWKFNPTILNGAPTAVRTTAEIPFVLPPTANP